MPKDVLPTHQQGKHRGDQGYLPHLQQEEAGESSIHIPEQKDKTNAHNFSQKARAAQKSGGTSQKVAPHKSDSKQNVGKQQYDELLPEGIRKDVGVVDLVEHKYGSLFDDDGPRDGQLRQPLQLI